MVDNETPFDGFYRFWGLILEEFLYREVAVECSYAVFPSNLSI